MSEVRAEERKNSKNERLLRERTMKRKRRESDQERNVKATWRKKRRQKNKTADEDENQRRGTQKDSAALGAKPPKCVCRLFCSRRGPEGFTGGGDRAGGGRLCRNTSPPRFFLSLSFFLFFFSFFVCVLRSGPLVCGKDEQRGQNRKCERRTVVPATLGCRGVGTEPRPSTLEKKSLKSGGGLADSNGRNIAKSSTKI